MKGTKVSEVKKHPQKRNKTVKVHNLIARKKEVCFEERVEVGSIALVVFIAT